MATEPEAAAPWHAAFPAPQTTAGCITRDKVLCHLKALDGLQDARYLLVDVRRTDCEGGTIRGSLNLPAQSLCWGLESLYALAVRSGLDAVVFYCGWFADTIKAHVDAGEDVKVKSLVLEGGIKGWVRSGDEYTSFMEGYKADAWQSTEQ